MFLALFVPGQEPIALLEIIILLRTCIFEAFWKLQNCVRTGQHCKALQIDLDQSQPYLRLPHYCVEGLSWDKVAPIFTKRNMHIAVITAGIFLIRLYYLRRPWSQTFWMSCICHVLYANFFRLLLKRFIRLVSNLSCISIFVIYFTFI